MSAVTVPSAAAGRPQQKALDDAAATARRALDCDGALITWPTGDGAIAVGADGADAHELERDAAFAMHVALPMTAGGEAVGVLHLLNRDRPGDLDMAFAEAIAEHFGVALHQESVCPVAAAERSRQQATLDQLALSADSLTNLIPKLERALVPIFGTVRIGLMFWDDERSVLQMVRGSFGAPESVTASCQLDPQDVLHSAAALVFGLQQTYVINDPGTDPGIRPEYVEAFRVEHLISAPLVVNERPTGVLHITRGGDPFSVADMEQCNDVAPRIAIAVESTRLLMRLSQQREVEAVLTHEAVDIASGTGSRAGLEQRLDELRAVFGASVIALAQPDSDPLVAKEPDVPAAVEQRLIDAARRERHERATFERPGKAGDPGSATLYVPVRAGPRLVGTLVTHRTRHESFTMEERQGLSRMASLIALSWAWERYQQQRAALTRLEERQRIADDLHDKVAQILFAAQMQLDCIIEDAAVSEENRTHAALARALLIRGDKAIREVIAKISRPLATGLPDRLYEVVESIDEEFRVPVYLEISDEAVEAGRRAPRAAGDTLVRVAREALVNTAKHAGPCRASVTLDLPAADRLRLRVTDSGTGNATRRRAESHGLTSLRRSVRRHGGSLRVTRGKAGGTVVTASLPI